ncbi:MAG TPA: hypothetical protein PLQ54_20360 [Armatimonadota bacterium]|nr:hypothetical protein [Armatimonadota bacterium]
MTSAGQSSALLIQRQAVEAVAYPQFAQLAWDSRDVMTADGLPLIGLRTFESLEVRASGRAPARGLLRIAVSSGGSRGPDVVRLALQAGEAIPDANLFAVAGTIDDRGVTGEEYARRALRQSAFGGAPTQYPEFAFCLWLQWVPAAGSSADPLALDWIALTGFARPTLEVYGD